MQLVRAGVVWMLGVSAPIAIVGRAGAGTIVSATAVGPGSLDSFTVNVLDTVSSNNDNAAGPVPNRFDVSAGVLSPSPIDIVITVVDESGVFPWATEYEFEVDVSNNASETWLGYYHVLGFGTGDQFELVPINSVDFDALDFDLTPSSSVFGFMPFYQYSGSRQLQWWGGQTSPVPPGGQVSFTFHVDVPNSDFAPEAFHTKDGYTFTLRQYPRVPPPPPPPGWYRGNTHTHSDRSFDGKDSPADLAAFYEAMDYDFLVLTDHATIPPSGAPWIDFSQYSTPDLLCISGEEMTTSTNHTNGLGTTASITPGSIAQNVAAVLAQGGVPHLAHPVPTLGQASDILAVPDLMHIEVRNGFFCCPHDYTDVWDQVLSAGKSVYGIASDDSHDMHAHAGQAWIVVRADALDQPSILAAIGAGNFYASTGITLNDFTVDENEMCVDSVNGDEVWFIGNRGAVLQQTQAPLGHYVFTGTETYVRAEVRNASGQIAWTQPVHFAVQCPWDCDTATVGVDVSDLLALMAQWDAAPPACTGGTCDIDRSGCVDITDLLLLLANWGACP